MTEEKIIIRRMKMIIIWVLFICFTVSGLISAYEQTRFVDEGTETVTVKYDFKQ